jgi:hypothetical protein
MDMYHNTAQDSAGNIINGAQVTVTIVATGALAALYDKDNIELGNPFNSGYERSKGEIDFKAVDGVYNIQIVSGDTETLYSVSLFDSAASAISSLSPIKTQADLADADATLTAAQLKGGLFTITPTVARTLTTDTAANIIAAMIADVDNDTFEFTIVNKAAFDVTLEAGAFVTFEGNVITNNGSATWIVRRLTSSTVALIRKASSSAWDYAKLSDVKADGTNGGTFTLGAYQTRTLNTVSDAVGFVTLAANQFTLQSGVYYINASAPAYLVDFHKARIQNITSTSTALLGSVALADSVGNGSGDAIVSGEITITAEATFELQHQCLTTVATTGFGRATSFGDNEIYSVVEIWRKNV